MKFQTFKVMTLIELAKLAVQAYINEGKKIKVPADFAKEYLQRKAGVFVTIEKEGELRWCIGTYLATKQNIAEEIIDNAIVAATQDNRFSPILKEELPKLSYTVYVLEEPKLAETIEELDPKKYGIIVSRMLNISGGVPPAIVKSVDSPFKTGLLLPDLQGVDTVQKQIAIACQKAGIDPKEESIAVYKFEVQKHG